MHSSSQLPNVAISAFVLLLTISTTLTSCAYGKIPSLPLPALLVHQFLKPTWIENLAVRSNGQILVTLLTTPDLYLIDPSAKPPTATLVHSFPSVLALSAITEGEPDVFYVAGGNVSVALVKNTPGTYSVWEVDLRFYQNYPESSAIVRKVTSIPEAGFLNGGVTLSTFLETTILLADSLRGGVWKVNVWTGAYSFAISDPTMNPVATAPFNFVGIDGVKIRHTYLYYTNFDEGVFYRVPISGSGTATGTAEVLAMGIGMDDFALDNEGRAWIAQNTVNLVSLLLSDGTLVDVVGATDQLTVAGVTSCAFGRGLATADLLYCTTSGAILNPVNGMMSEGGKVVVIDTAGFQW